MPATVKTDFHVQFPKFMALWPKMAEHAYQGAINGLVGELQHSMQQGGNTPEDTGFLLSRLRISRNRAPLHVGRVGHGAAVATLKLGDVVTLDRFGVPYAAAQEYGFTLPSGAWFTGRFYTTQAVQNWPKHVTTAIAATRSAFLSTAMRARGRP